MKKDKEYGGRNSGIELLRLVCLILIFWMHASGSYTDNRLSAWIGIAVAVVGNVGVSCFILISGYYGIKLDGRKMLHLECLLLFYSWTALLLKFAWGERPAGEEMLSFLFPVIGKQSWYFTCYFVIAFLSPFLNEAVEKFGERRLRQLLAALLFLFSGVTTFFFFDINGDGGKGIVHMVMLYLLGRYLGRYKKEAHVKTKRLAGLFFLLAAVNFGLNGVLYLLTGTVQNRFARDNTLFTIAEAVLLFLLFRNLYFENRVVNRAAKCVPAVFFFEWSLRGIVSRYLFDYTAFSSENGYEALLLAVAVLLAVIGTMTELLRNGLLGRAEGWLVEHVYTAGGRIAVCLRDKLQRQF